MNDGKARILKKIRKMLDTWMVRFSAAEIAAEVGVEEDDVRAFVEEHKAHIETLPHALCPSCDMKKLKMGKSRLKIKCSLCGNVFEEGETEEFLYYYLKHEMREKFKKAIDAELDTYIERAPRGGRSRKQVV